MLKDKTTLFLIGIAIFMVAIIIMVAAITISQTNSLNEPVSTPTPVPVSPALTPPSLESDVSIRDQGVFTVTFPIAPDPDNLTITLASSSISNPSSPTVPVQFTSEFEDDGKFLVITTVDPIENGRIYTLYVRLVSNNHIVVKHRYESANGVLTIIDTN